MGAAVSSWSWNFSRSFQDSPCTALQPIPSWGMEMGWRIPISITGWRIPEAPHVGVDGWRGLTQPVPEDPHPFSRNSLLSQPGLLCIPWCSKLGHQSVGTATQKWCKTLQKLHWGVRHRSSTCPAPPTFAMLIFGCCGATPGSPPAFSSRGCHQGRAGWKVEGLGWIGRDLKACLVPTPFHHPTLLQAQHSSRFLILYWFPHALSCWGRKYPFPGWKPPHLPRLWLPGGHRALPARLHPVTILNVLFPQYLPFCQVLVG